MTHGIGTVPIDHSVLNAAFEDQVTPIAPATPAFTDDAGEPDGLSVADGPYKVVFLGFPMEAYGTTAQRADLMKPRADVLRVRGEPAESRPAMGRGRTGPVPAQLCRDL